MESKRLKVLVVGDSLALPGHGCRYEDTWVYGLKQMRPSLDVSTVLRRGLTTNVLVEEGGGEGSPPGADTLEHYAPDVVVLQLGIVDCAPRLFSESERRLMRVLPQRAVKLYVGLGTRFRRRRPQFAYVDPVRFESNLRRYLERCVRAGVRGVIVVGVPSGGSAMRAKNPGIEASARLYNSLIRRQVAACPPAALVEPFADADDSLFCEDGYHPSALGHRRVLESVLPAMDGKTT